MEVDIISSENVLAAVTDEWKCLQVSAARFPFADPAAFSAWWQIRGRQGGRKLHVAAARQDGRLVALAPLVVTRRWGMRVLEWGGSEIFDYCDTLVADPSFCEPLWNTVRRSGLYDFGLLRDVHPRATCNGPLAAFARRTRHSRVEEIRFEWRSGDTWMVEALSALDAGILSTRRAPAVADRAAPV